MKLKLKVNTQVEVNQEQYNWTKKYCKGLIAYRKDAEGKFWIKPLIFMGHKQQIETELNKLN